jgi:hypothetical protein
MTLDRIANREHQKRLIKALVNCLLAEQTLMDKINPDGCMFGSAYEQYWK